MVRLVVEATNTKAPIQRIAEKVSGLFVPSIIIIAIISMTISSLTVVFNSLRLKKMYIKRKTMI